MLYRYWRRREERALRIINQQPLPLEDLAFWNARREEILRRLTQLEEDGAAIEIVQAFTRLASNIYTYGEAISFRTVGVVLVLVGEGGGELTLYPKYHFGDLVFCCFLARRKSHISTN